MNRILLHFFSQIFCTGDAKVTNVLIKVILSQNQIPGLREEYFTLRN